MRIVPLTENDELTFNGSEKKKKNGFQIPCSFSCSVFNFPCRSELQPDGRYLYAIPVLCAGVQALLERITGAPASAVSTQRRRCRRHRNAQKAPVHTETKRAFNGKANLIPACDL